jgi:hypothetical protein
MAKWKQISGDMDFSGVGCVLALDNPQGRYVDLVKITPWLEMDSQALREGYDYDDMGADKPDVKSAMSYTGVEADEYKDLDPAHKADIIASASGYGDSRSTSDFADALPAPIDEIAFWRKGSAKDLDSINDNMRFEVVSKLYGNKFKHGKLPDHDVLKLAFGDEPRTFELSEDEAQALRYALAVADGSYGWIFPKAKPEEKLSVKDSDTMLELLEALRDAPDSASLPPHKIDHLQSSYQRSFDLNWEDKREQVIYFIDEDAKETKSLIDNLLGNLGF